MSFELEQQRGLEDRYPRKAPNYPVHFYDTLRENPAKTRAAQVAAQKAEDEKALAEGRDPVTVPPVETVWDKFDYAKISVTGTNDVIDRAVTEEIKAKYPREWAAYKNGEKFDDGMPLAEWTRLPEPIKLRLQLVGIYTVEQFITAPEIAIKDIAPAMMRFQAEAREFLGNKVIQAQQEKLAAKDAEFAEMKAQLASLMAAQTDSKPVNRRGRQDNSNETA